MFRVDWASCIPVVIAGVVAASQGISMAMAQEQTCASNLASCDFQERKTHLRAQLWAGPCDPSRWDSLPPEGFPIERRGERTTVTAGPRAPVHFLNGVCEMHRPNGDLDQGLRELEKAATLGLLPAQKSAAALFEGLLHCRKLAELQSRYRGDLTEKLDPRERFCMHRGMAKASFTRVQWEGLEMSYDTSEFSLTGHAEAMAQCYADFLHAGYDATCGIVASPSAEAIEAAAETVSSDILADYFGSATADVPDGDQAIPPLKAMLARKIEMADTSLQASAALLESLASKRNLLVDSYRGIGSMFCVPDDTATGLCSGPLPSAVAQLHQEYERAVLRTQGVIDFVDRWVNGLYEYQGRDVRTELSRSEQSLRETLARAEQPSVPNEMTLVQKLDFVKRDMALLARRDATDQEILKQQCSIYFCEVRNRNRTIFTRACDQIDAVTGRRVRETNALCAADVAQTFVTSTETAQALCERAGFGGQYVSGAALPARVVDTCMSEFHP